jgi:hypothetical protein
MALRPILHRRSQPHAVRFGLLRLHPRQQGISTADARRGRRCGVVVYRPPRQHWDTIAYIRGENPLLAIVVPQPVKLLSGLWPAGILQGRFGDDTPPVTRLANLWALPSPPCRDFRDRSPEVPDRPNAIWPSTRGQCRGDLFYPIRWMARSSGLRSSASQKPRSENLSQPLIHFPPFFGPR